MTKPIRRKIEITGDDLRPDPQAQLYGALRHKPARDQLLCAALLHRALREMRKEGHQVAPEIVGSVQRAALVQYGHMAPTEKAHLFKVMPGHCDSLMKACKVDDARKVLLAVSLTVLKVVEDGLIEDPGGMAVLAALSFVEDAKQEPHEWRYNEAEANAAARQVHDAAQLLGYW